MNERIIPEGGKNPYADHPGFVADGCTERMTITRSGAWGGVQGGFACRVTGGHCLPCDKCDDRRATGVEFDKRQAMFAAARAEHDDYGPIV